MRLSVRSQRSRAALALGAALAAVVLARPASARPTELVGSAGILSPTRSDYRNAAETLGYDRRGLRTVFELEVGGLKSLNWWLSVGPIARAYLGRLGSPYEGVPPIATLAGTLGARVEFELFPWPRIFTWAEPSIGVGSIGTSESSRTIGLWGLRGGLGIATARDAASLRFRVGFAYAPTFGAITPATGTFDYGGFTFQIDGVLRVLG